MTQEAPKRYTATNSVTGDLIKSRGDNQDKYAAGWDAIFGKKEEPSKETLDMFANIDKADCWTMDNALEDYKDVPEESPVGTIFKISDIIENPEHEAYAAVMEMLGKLERGEIFLS